jgi:ribonuclease Z
MKVVFLGTTGYHPNESRQTACFMLPELGVVLDAGTGMFRARNYFKTDHLEIFLSHVHLDHCIGLTFLFDVLRDTRTHDVRVYAEPEKLASIDQHLFAPSLFPVKPPCDFFPLEGSRKPLMSGGEISWFPLDHPGGAWGYLVEYGGKRLAYVTDTTASVSADYVERIREVDLLIHECYFPDGEEELAELTGHSCATPVAEVAAKAQVGRLVLVHVNPMDESGEMLQCEAMQKIFPNTTLAHDGMELNLGGT